MDAQDTAFAALTPEEAIAPKKNRVAAKFFGNTRAIIGCVLVGTFLLIALLAPLIAPYDPNKTNFLAVRQAPSAVYWLGTDEIGRDILSRVMYGGIASLYAGVVAVLIALAIGLPVGLAAGWFGGWTDALISRATDALLAVPFLILAIALAAALGPSLTNAMIAIGLSQVPIFVRLTRGQVLSVKAEDFVEGARAVGVPNLLILARHITPNITAPLLVQATLTTATSIIAEASLSFLGLGQQPPAPSWGSMLNTAKNFLEQAPWMSLSPGIAIFLVVLGFNLLGDGLRDALDPREE
ncbi:MULTISPECIES: ABC transporter permease [Rhodomicrobium]|uniref:ABC transporter permease n=1 Tax=Rhodomicrobium TaxID=1068 RepID=UPI000B4B7ACD|nr:MULTISPECIES: ABC transporter permease [Rhodomicrobium]